MTRSPITLLTQFNDDAIALPKELLRDVTIYDNSEKVTGYFDKLHAAGEIAVHSHGLVSQDTEIGHKIHIKPKQEGTYKVFKKTIQNTKPDTGINTIHLLTCYTDAAQRSLNKVDGDLVLFTYCPADDTTGHGRSLKHIKSLLESNSVFEHLDNDVPLLVNGFSITYKIDGKTHIFEAPRFSSDQLIAYLQSTDEILLKSYLDKQSTALRKFYAELVQGELGTNHPKLFSGYNWLETRSFTEQEIKEAANDFLELGLRRNIKSNNSEMIKLLLKHKPDLPTNECLSLAVGELGIIKLLLKNRPDLLTDEHLTQAIYSGNTTVVEFLLEPKFGLKPTSIVKVVELCY